jgi:hypothetical protein
MGMSQIFDFEQIGQQSVEPRQGLVHGAASASGGYSLLPTTVQLTRIFSAAICSLVMAFFFFSLSQSLPISEIIATEPVFTLAGQVILTSAAFVLGVILFAGIPLALVTWQSTPRSRFLLAIPFLAIVFPLVALIHPLLNLALLLVLLAAIPLAIVTWRSMPRNRFLHLLPLFAIAALLVIPAIHVFKLASLIILLADLFLTVIVWRLTPPPRIRLGLLLPFAAVALLLVAIIFSIFLSSLGSFAFIDFIGNVIGAVLSYSIPIIGNLSNLVLLVLLCGIPMICTIAINTAIRQATIPDKWLRFTQIPSRLVVFGVIVMFLALLFWGLYLAVFAPALFFMLLSPLTAPWNSWLLIVIGMFISVIVVARTLSRDR